MSGIRSSADGVISNRMRFPAPEYVAPMGPSLNPLPIEADFSWFQDIAVNQMTIDHNLGVKPAAITLLSPDGQTRYLSFGSSYIDNNRVIITTDIPFRGWVLIT
jgi:hypothetical protein